MAKSKSPGHTPATETSRAAALGDTSPALSVDAIENFEVSEAVAAASTAKAVAVGDIIRTGLKKDVRKLAEQLGAIAQGASADDLVMLRKALLDNELLTGTGRTGVKADDELSDDWRTGGYPYRNLMSRKAYEKQKYHLQVELLKLQKWVKENGQKVVIVFEGRDAAGKGGTIKRFMEHLNPRGAHVVALEKPTETELGQWYFQRYVQHLPTSGEIVLFDRSWYNRAGVERVMGFCTPDEYTEFMRQAPEFERNLVRLCAWRLPRIDMIYGFVKAVNS